ncbi:hypothetical protein SRHO_G00252180 [Serrasalmus rhombeus]
MAAVDGSDSDFVWIGLERETSPNFIWSYDNVNVYATGERDYRNWDVNEPNGMSTDEKCVELRSNTKFNDLSCSTALPFICYNESSAQTYVTVYNVKSWPEAQNYCRDHYTDLASVRNQKENLELVKAQNVWIGLYSDSWGWSDQDGSTFRQWVLRQTDNYGGNENCVVASIASGGKWYEISCQQAFPFVCYGDPLSRKIRLRMKLRSSIKLTDPTVRDRVPQLLKAALNISGLLDVKLHWTKLQPEEPLRQEVLNTSRGVC